LRTAHKEVFEDEAALTPLTRAAAFPTGQLLVRWRRLYLDTNALVLGAAGWALEEGCFGHVIEML
jgi:hypothetical protein